MCGGGEGGGGGGSLVGAVRERKRGVVCEREGEKVDSGTVGENER